MPNELKAPTILCPIIRNPKNRNIPNIKEAYPHIVVFALFFLVSEYDALYIEGASSTEDNAL